MYSIFREKDRDNVSAAIEDLKRLHPDSDDETIRRIVGVLEAVKESVCSDHHKCSQCQAECSIKAPAAK